MTNEEEKRVIDAVISGNTSEFEYLVKKYENRVFSLCLRMVGNREDALDLAQESFVKSYKKLESFKGNSSFYVWLSRIVSNTCLDFLRREKKRSSDTSLTYEDESGAVKELQVSDIRYSPETVFESTELKENIQKGLLSLSPEHRSILIMREINSLSYDVISEILGISIGTVKSRISRARLQLAFYLTKSGNNPEANTSKKSKKNSKGGELSGRS